MKRFKPLLVIPTAVEESITPDERDLSATLEMTTNNNMNITNLLHLDYWFYQPFTARGLALWLLIGGFLFFIVAGLVFKILSQYQNEKSKRLILKRAGSLGITMGFLGLVWMFFRQERVAFLAWRFWLLLWFAVAAIWAYRLARYAIKRIPEIKAEEARRANVEKYLPKSK